MLKGVGFLMLLGFKILMLLDLSYTLFILPRAAIGYKKGNCPVRSLTVDEYRLLKKYYPKERFGRGVWILEGLHRSAASLGDWEGQDLINGIPVIFHSSAEEALNRGGDNKAKLAMGKRKAYVISLNGKYCITGSSGRVESHERFWGQWTLGLAGAIEGCPNAELLSQRESNKRETFYRAYLHSPEFASGDLLRFFGSFLSLISLSFFWFLYIGVFYFTYFYQGLFFFLGLIGAVLVFLPAYLVSKPEKINVVKGEYGGVEGDCFKVGGLSVRFNECGGSFLSNLSFGSLITVEVWVDSNMVVKINDESIFKDEALAKNKEPVKAPAIMMVLFLFSTVALFELSGNVLDFGSFCFFYTFSMTVIFFLIFLFKSSFRPFRWFF